MSAPARVPQAPDTPTAAEAGLPQFVASSWFAFYLPRATPDAIRDRLAAALNAALDDYNVRQKLEAAGLILPATDQRGPDALRRRMAEDIARWSGIVAARIFNWRSDGLPGAARAVFGASAACRRADIGHFGRYAALLKK